MQTTSRLYSSSNLAHSSDALDGGTDQKLLAACCRRFNMGSWKPNVPYGPDGRMAAACLPDGVFPLLFPDGAPTATHLDFQSIWPKSYKI